MGGSRDGERREAAAAVVGQGMVTSRSGSGIIWQRGGTVNVALSPLRFGVRGHGMSSVKAVGTVSEVEALSGGGSELSASMSGGRAMWLKVPRFVKSSMMAELDKTRLQIKV